MYQFALYPPMIPERLKPGRVWVAWNEKKAPMVPSLRGPRRYASSTDPTTWGTYEEALAAYETGRFSGIGRVLEAGGGLVGVDIDHCRDPESGHINDRARALLERLDSYSEASPSGAGVRVWCQGVLPTSYVKSGLEIYVRGRYLTTTGAVLPQYSADVEERTAALVEIVAEEFPRPERRRTGPRRAGAYSGPRLDLGELLEVGGIAVLAEISDASAARKFRVLCPWRREHTTAPETGTVVGQYEDGPLFFRCWHSHCQHRTWRDFRREIFRPRRAADLLEVSVTYG